jgi:hypothetical protein
MNYSTTIAIPITDDMLQNGTQITATDTVKLHCSGLVALLAVFTWEKEEAFTLVEWSAAANGNAYNCQTLPITGVTICYFNTSNHCTVATTPPDLSVSGVNDTFDSLYQKLDWIVTAKCIRVLTSGPWLCSPFAIAAKVAINTGAPLYPCTHHP